MAIRVDIKRCRIFGEFSPEEAEAHFGTARNKVIHNVDTLYYGVTLDEHDIEQRRKEMKVRGQVTQPGVANAQLSGKDAAGNDVYRIESGIDYMVGELNALRENFNFDEDNPTIICGLIYKPTSFALYRHCLSEKDAFDIFIASSVPNDKTPRIVVQIRSALLWGMGDREATAYSFQAVQRILQHYGLTLKGVTENRIDWAFHTNLIQDTYKYLNDKLLREHLNGSLTLYHKVGQVGKEITVDYLSLGKRQSNNVFFRCYDKTREVVEMGYKAIFIDIWHREKLISDYDRFVLENAYKYKSFSSGINLGRIDWYLEYGKSEGRKAWLREIRETYLVKSTNNTVTDDLLDGLLPAVTRITNFEWQTKRRFYWSFGKSISPDMAGNCLPELWRLYAILDNRKLFLDRLTRDYVRFVKERHKPVAELEPTDYLYFWQRIRSCKLSLNTDKDIFRDYQRGCEVERMKRAFASSVASLSVLQGTEDFNFAVNLADALCYFNDNDVDYIKKFVDEDTGELDGISIDNYDVLVSRKLRQYSFLLKEMKKTQNHEMPTRDPEPFSD